MYLLPTTIIDFGWKKISLLEKLKSKNQKYGNINLK